MPQRLGTSPSPSPRRCRLLTHGEPQQAVGEEAGSQEGSPQHDIQLLRDLRLHPHEQAARETGLSQAQGVPQTRQWRRAGRDLLLDLFQDVGHLAKEVLCEAAAVVRTDPGAADLHSSTKRAPGSWAAPRTPRPRTPPRPEPGATACGPAPPPAESESGVNTGMVTPDPALCAPHPRSWPGPAGRVSDQMRGPCHALGLSQVCVGTTVKPSTGQLMTARPGLETGCWGPTGQDPGNTWAFWATSSTSWNFSDTVRSSFGGSFSQRGQSFH